VQAATSSDSEQAKKRRRWLRCRPRTVLVGVLVLGAVCACGLWLAARSPLTRFVVLRAIEASLAIDARAQGVRVGADGIIRMDDLVLRTGAGKQGKFLRARRCLIDLDWRSLLDGRLKVSQIVLDGATARISVERGSGRLNIEPLIEGAGKPGRFEVPEIVLGNATIELGEHDESGYSLLTALQIDGLLTRLTDRPGFAVGVSERTGSMRLSGVVTPERVALEVSQVDLARFGPERVPSAIRPVIRVLDLEGRVATMGLAYSEGEGLVARVDLSGISMNLPFDREGRFVDAPQELARMQDVRGRILLSRAGVSADLSGSIEGLNYDATLRSAPEGASQRFTLSLATRGYALDEEQRLRPYVPRAIERALADISHPSGEIDAQVRLGGRILTGGRIRDARIEEGRIVLRDVRAAHARFPYEVRHINGTIEFSSEEARLVEVTGQGETGARISASGSISPLDENARLYLSVRVDGAPIDDALARALEAGGAGGFLEEVFSRARLDELRTLAPDPSLDGFTLGGVVDASLELTSSQDDLRVDAQIEAPYLGIVPKRFPMAFIGEHVQIRADEQGVRLVGGSFRTARGTPLELAAGIDVAPRAGEIDALPWLRVRVRDLPASDDLIHAISQAGNVIDDRRDWTRRMLLNLGIEGRVDADVDVRVAGGDAQFGVRLGGDGLVIRPRASLPAGVASTVEPLAIEQVSASVEASHERVRVDLSGRLDDAPVTTGLVLQFGGQTPRLLVEGHAEDLNLEQPVESLVAVFSEDASLSLAELRREFNPGGRVVGDLRLVLDEPSSEPDIAIEIHRMAGLEGDTDLGRVRLTSQDGLLAWSSDGLVRFSELRARCEIDGRPEGQVRLDGWVQAGDPSHEGDLSVSLRGLPVEGVLVREGLARVLSERAMPRWQSLEPEGVVDAEAHIEGRLGDAGGSEFRVSVQPRALSLADGDQRIVLDDMDGSIEFDAVGFDLRGLGARLGDLAIRADGRIALMEEGAELICNISLDAPSLTPDLRARLPKRVREAFEGLDLTSSGAALLRCDALRLAFNDDGTIVQLESEGRLTLEGASLSAGTRIAEARVQGRYRGAWSEGRSPELEASFAVPSLRAGGVAMGDGEAHLSLTPAGDLWLSRFSATVHGGRVAGDLILREALQGGRDYAIRLRGGEIDLAGLIRDNGLSSSADGSGAEDAVGGTRGRLQGELSLSGRLGDAASRRGRGTARVVGGSVVDVPLLLQLVSVANLRLPSSAPVALAVASFYIDGDRVVFEDLSAFAGDIEIFGFGSMTIADRVLDLRFVPRVANPIPLVGDLVAGLNRELMTVRVRGTLREAKVESEVLRGTRALVGRVTGSRSEADELLERFERQAERARERFLRLRVESGRARGADGSTPP